MKKKVFPVLASAMLLAFGAATMSAYAAEGWAQQNNTWVYLDKYDNRVTNEWKKGADNLWRWLNDSGEMAVDCWADENYYVDSNGIMVTDKWMKTTSQFDEDGDQYYFYFSSNGKMVRDGWKKINDHQYLFDTEGIMQSGWTDDGMYYLGGPDDGSMKTGWRYLEDRESSYEDEWGPESDENMHWYYFSSSGKKHCAADDATDGDYRISRIDGHYYCFDYEGRMQTGWVYLNGDPDSAEMDSIEDWRYFAEPGIANTKEGAAITGWLSLEPPERLMDNVDEPVVWYYFEKNGKPKFGPRSGEASTDDFVRVDGKNYLFNQKGNPVSGLQKVEIGDTGEFTSYYFDENSKTALKGRRTVEEGDGSRNTFYFNEGSYSGRGVTGVKDGYLYYMGKRQEADSGLRYMPVSIRKDDGTYTTYVVNSSGRASKNTTVKDNDDVYYKLNSNGHLTQISLTGDRDDLTDINPNENYGDPIEPIFYEDDY